MPSQPLSVILLLFFLLLIAAALTAWFALTQGERQQPTEVRAPRKEVAGPTPVPRPSNDEIRGARVRPEPAHRAAASDEDPFERFIRSKNDDMKL